MKGHKIMTISDILSLFSGIALFLFGMSLMGDGLKRLSGNKLEPILYKLSNRPVKGLALGCGVTAVIQSSSATSVIVMGFVNSGMMKLKQAIPVILGAILGTSITGWIICLSYIEGSEGVSSLLSTATLTGVVAIAGIIMRMFCKGKVQQNIGSIMMGFAILMFGMSMMSGSVEGLMEEAWFNDVLISMRNPLLGIITGVLIAAVLQSASAAVGIIQALSVTGAVVFENAFPLLLGISIGAALPVMIAALGTNIDGRRTALSYLISCVMGVMICASVFYIADAIFAPELDATQMTPVSTAIVNTAFRLFMILILLPLSDVIEALTCLIIKDKTADEKDKIFIDERFLRHPALAIEQSHTTIIHMAEEAGQAVKDAGLLIDNYTDAGFEHVETLEADGDSYEDVLGSFLMKLSGQDLSDRQEKESTIFLHTMSDFERITDHALNIAESAKEINEKKLSFSDEAAHELSVMNAAVREILKLTITAFKKEDLDIAAHVEPLEEVIDDLCDEMKFNHAQRLQHGKCSISQGFVFNDLLTNYERIADHCSNVAVALIEINSGAFATHEYLENMDEDRTKHFKECYNEYKLRFAVHAQQ